MKSVWLLCLVVMALLILSCQAFAASDITVTVTLQQVGVDVTPTAWDLGVMVPGDSQSSWVSGVAGYFTATNTGNVDQDFAINTGSTSPSGWTAGTSSATDVYVIAFGIAVDPYTSEPTYTTFTSETTLTTGVSAEGTASFDLKFTAPGEESTFDAGGETFTVSLSASAS